MLLRQSKTLVKHYLEGLPKIWAFILWRGLDILIIIIIMIKMEATKRTRPLSDLRRKSPISKSHLGNAGLTRKRRIYWDRNKWVESEYQDSDGYWIDLKPGFKSGHDPVGTVHGIHEDTKREAYLVLADTLICKCEECQKVK